MIATDRRPLDRGGRACDGARRERRQPDGLRARPIHVRAGELIAANGGTTPSGRTLFPSGVRVAVLPEERVSLS